jgi:hypothetical protein
VDGESDQTCQPSRMAPMTVLATVLKILLVQRARILGRPAEAFPNGSRSVGLAGVCWRVTVIEFVLGSGRLLSAQRPAVQSWARPQPGNFGVEIDTSWWR